MAKPSASAVGLMGEGERIFHSVEARVRVFKKAEKAWGDLDFGDFAIAVGGGADKRGARVGFKAPLATRPALAAELNDAVKVVEVAAKDGKHGGLQLTLLVTVRGKAAAGADAGEPPTTQELTMYLVRPRTAEGQAALLAALSKAQKKQI